MKKVWQHNAKHSVYILPKILNKKRESYESQVKDVKARISQTEANKYTKKKTIKKLNEELAGKERLVKFPITAESSLKDGAVEAAFPNITWLLKLYIKIPHSQAGQ